MWLPLTHPQLGTWSATQACALTGNRTGDLLTLRLALSPLNHTIQGRFWSLLGSWNLFPLDTKGQLFYADKEEM